VPYAVEQGDGPQPAEIWVAMFDLHERLSEFSYGYGVTREFEVAFKRKGIRAVPFLPSLLQEAKVGFDVAWNKPGAPLMVQFKLGLQLQRFRTRAGGGIPQPLDRPFWRFNVDTASTGGQFMTLLGAERKGAEVYYAAPRFSTWSDYVTAFQDKKILERSLLIRPSVINRGAQRVRHPSGIHLVVYDETNRYVCSDPVRIESQTLEEVVSHLTERLATGESLQSIVSRLFHAEIGPETPQPSVAQELRARRTIRDDFLERVRARAASEDDAIAITIAAEAWAKGTLTIFCQQQG
jgi:hypothetical protein